MLILNEPQGGTTEMPHRRFEVISSDRCLELLRSQAIGRIAWSSADGIQVRPVHYAVVEPDIVFQVDSGDLLAELSEPRQVAFEVDKFDIASRAAWSVVVRGLSRATTGAAGSRGLTIAIAMRHVGGRIVGGV